MTKYNIIGFRDRKHMLSEYEKANRDKDYSPQDEVIGQVEADYWRAAQLKAEKEFPKENHGFLFVEETS